MAKNKHALIRYRALDKCFSNHRVKYSFADLMREVNKALEAYDPATKGISRSMLYEDIAFMESTDGWGADIERIREGRYTYRRYADEDFSIQNMPLNELELSQLKEAVNVLSQFKGLPQFEWMEEVVAKLHQGTQPAQSSGILSFDANQYLKGIEWLGTLYNAVLYQKTLCLTYKDFKAPEAYEFIFHPYHLKQYNNRWFAFGYCPESNRTVSTIALDRIEAICDHKDAYLPNTTVDFREYFEDIVGVSKPENTVSEHLTIWIHPNRAGYVITKPLHGSQKKISNDGTGLVISLDLIVNPELIQLLLSFGASLKVITPQNVQTRLLEEICALQANYQEILTHTHLPTS